MKAKIEITLQPFTVPDYIQTEKATNFISLTHIDAETLEALCEKFTDDVFKKAGKDRPPKIINYGPGVRV